MDMSEKLHIIPHDHKITKVDRSRALGQRPCVVWFTGLSGSGKSTVANCVEQDLMSHGFHTYLLDGDNVRTGLNGDVDFTEAGRIENIRRLGELSKLMVDAGLIVLTAFISPFKADRKRVRDLLAAGEMVEVHVDVPLEVAESRDPKGLYKKARKGEISNFTGIDSPFEVPENPEIRIDTDKDDLEENVRQVLEVLLPKITLEDE
ncbi:MAG: adenylyl-sulfate kinase [Flavobacteriales bacterium]|nr:adenylyl-sulfate kinase [Flavobacteriales bacterium]